ncbi:MAG: DUF3662 domain-containing protein [Anaerovibrio sp.]|nr:DUF3662 domain-containing protein [Anaerovibrio sp.]
MSIGRLESFLEKHIEGFFNRKLGGSVEQSEIMKQLERELLHRRKKGRAEAVVPNSFYIELTGEDYQRLCVRNFLDELYIQAEKLVIRNDCFMDGDLAVTINSSSELAKGTCTVSARFTDDGPQTEEITQAECNTIILDKSAFNPPLNLPTEYKMVSLLAVDGPDIDSYLEFGEKQIYLGRRVNNDFILTDNNASRVHAYIAYERHRHILYDAESLNGTFVNGQRVVSPQLLRVGDEITIGETVLLYEVI